MFPHFQLDILILSDMRELDLALFQRIVGRAELHRTFPEKREGILKYSVCT